MKFNPRASIFFNGDFYEIVTQDQGMIIIGSLDIDAQIFPPDTSDEALGLGLRQALQYSKQIPFDKFQEIWRTQAMNKRNDDREVNLIKSFGYKNKRELYRNMDTCSITLQDGKIEIQPTHQQDFKGGYTVKADTGPFAQYISETASNAELGAAIREGLSRCTSAVR